MHTNNKDYILLGLEFYRMRFFSFVFLSCFVAAFGVAAPASVWGCPAYVDTKIKSTPLYGEPAYDHSLDLQSIDMVSRRAQLRVKSDFEVPMGFTETTQRLLTSFEILMEEQPDKTLCAQLSRFEFKYGFPETTVFIARELEEDTCEYQEVLAHENKHVLINKKMLQTYMPHLTSLLPELMRDAGVVRFRTQKEAEGYFQDLIDRYMARLLANVTTIYNNEQRAVDTPEEYKRLSTVCNGALAKMIALKKGR